MVDLEQKKQPFNQKNLVPQDDVGLDYLLRVWEQKIKLGFNCHAIGTVQSFNAANQTATVTINYSKTFLRFNDSTSGYSQGNKNYPVLIDSPCVVLGGGLGCLTFPIAKGDECVVLFNDRDMDNWFATSSATSPTDTPRSHSFADAMILVGMRSTRNVIVDYDEDAVALRMGTNFIKIYEDHIVINQGEDGNGLEVTATEVVLRFGDNTITLNDESAVIDLDGQASLELKNTGKLKITNSTGEFVAALNQLLLDIQAATASGFPLIMPTFPTDLTTFQSFLEP